MNQFLQQGVVGTGHVVRTIAIASVDLTRQLEQLARSALTGVVVIGAGHLLGNQAYRGLGDEAASSRMPASEFPAVEAAASAPIPQRIPLNAA
jgi:hypothetical protein